MKTKFVCLFFIVLCLFPSSKSEAQSEENQILVDSIFREIDKESSLIQKVKILTRIAGKNRYQDFTKKLIEKSLQLSIAENSYLGMANSYYSLGNYYYFKSKLDTAKLLFNNALQLTTEINDPALNSSILTSLSGIQKKEGHFSQAISSLFQAKEILESIDTLQLDETEKKTRFGRKGVINNSLATIYAQLEDFESAIYYYDICYNTFIRLNNPVVAGIVLANKGELLLQMEKYDEALTAQKKGKELKIEGVAPERSIALSELNIGIILSKTNHLDESLKSLNKALNVFEKLDYPEGKMNALTSRGNLYLKQHFIDKAIADCQKAKNISFKLRDVEIQKTSCNCLYRAYKMNNNIKLALENHELYLEKKELILSEKNIKKITQLEMQFDFDRKEELLEAENIAKEKENSLIIKSLIGGIASLLLIALLYFRLFRIRKKTAINLAKKNLQIKTALSEKEVLLKEIHHRVKNNLQVVSSLLSMQGRQIKDPLATQAINDVKNRVKAMALIHQNLYQNDNLTGVDAQDYIEKLTQNLILNYNTLNKEIKISTDIDKLKLDIDTIIPCGLIINELVTNSLKYAFKEDKNEGIIHVILKKEKNGLILEISDNGVGLPNDFEIEKTSSLGFKLIKAFSQKLKAKLIINNKQIGTIVRLEIPDYTKIE